MSEPGARTPVRRTRADDGEGPPNDTAGAAAPRHRSRYLVNEESIPLYPSLAVALESADRALVLQQLNYWLRSSKHFHDRRWWVYNTLDEWQQQFPWLHRMTVRRILTSLRERGLIITGNYNKRGTDQTLWYTIDDEAVGRLLGLASGVDSTSPDVQKEQLSGVQIEHLEINSLNTRDVQDEHLERFNLNTSSVNNRLLPGDLSTKTTIQRQQQQQRAPGGATAPGGVVVVDNSALIERLAAREVGAAAARRLVAGHPAATVARQLAHYDWERAAAPGDARLTPGRLVRRIEEDWAPPPGFPPAGGGAAPADAAARRRHPRNAF